MSRLAQRRRALIRYRWRARYSHLTIPRGDYEGWPDDVREAYSTRRDPEFEALYGWIFSAWQYQPSKTNPPWWFDPRPYAEQLKPGDWVLRRPPDGHIFAVLSPEAFDRWQGGGGDA